VIIRYALSALPGSIARPDAILTTGKIGGGLKSSRKNTRWENPFHMIFHCKQSA
jgi:hypothetical protein